MVKGAYDESPDIAYPRRRDVDENFFRLATRLLSEEAVQKGARLAAGTHDLRLLRQITEHAVERGLSKKDFEIQMLYGIQSAAQKELAAEGHAVRVLVAFGTEWYPWFFRRLAERPANVWFLLRNLF